MLQINGKTLTSNYWYIYFFRVFSFKISNSGVIKTNFFNQDQQSIKRIFNRTCCLFRYSDGVIFLFTLIFMIFFFKQQTEICWWKWVFFQIYSVKRTESFQEGIFVILLKSYLFFSIGWWKCTQLLLWLNKIFICSVVYNILEVIENQKQKQSASFF